MIFEEPKVKFVAIDLNDVIVTSTTGTGGGQRCVASQEDAQSCSPSDTQFDWGT